MRQLAATLSALFVSAAVLGCSLGGDETTQGAEEPGAPASVSVREQNQKLVAAGTAGRVVLRLWGFMQAGAVPAAAALYDPAVRRKTGISPLAGALADQQFALADYELPVVVSRESTTIGQVLTVVAQAPDKAPLTASYVLRRGRDGRWKVAYDSVMAAAIRTWVTNRVQDTIRPGAKVPSSRAQASGNDVAERFRLALFDDRARLERP